MNTSDALHIGCNVSLRLVIDAINSYKHLAPYSDFKPWKSVWWIKEEGGWWHIWHASPKRVNSYFLNLTRIFNMSVCGFGRDNPSLFFKNSFPEIQRIHDGRSLLHLTFSLLVSGRAKEKWGSNHFELDVGSFGDTCTKNVLLLQWLFDDLLISLILLGPFLVFGRLGRPFPPGTATK